MKPRKEKTRIGVGRWTTILLYKRREERDPELGRILAQNSGKHFRYTPLLRSDESLDEAECSGEKLQA